MPGVCLDAGHGGYDPGAVGPTGLKEKDVTLAVTLQAGLYLQNAGIAVLFTRTDDQVPWPAEPNADLAARCKIANQYAVDLFVSIHCNSSKDPVAHGVETYSLWGTGKGAEAARLIQAELVKALRLADRGTRVAGFFVLRRTYMPAALSEVAFISNRREEKLLRDKVFQEKAAWAIARGVAAYFGMQLPQVPPPPTGPRLIIGGVLVTDVPIKEIDGKAYAWIPPLVARLGWEAKWDEKTRTIYVLPRRPMP